MDPDANIAAQRRLTAEILACDDVEHDRVACTCIAKAGKLAELVEALDGWICSGGFLPRTWSK